MDKTAKTDFTELHVLPAFARFILENHLDDYIKAQLAIARQMDIPMLREVLKLPDEAIITSGREGNIEYLNFLAENKYPEYVARSNERWLQDQLEFAGKYDVVADDITNGVFLRSKALKQLISRYCRDIDQALLIADEIDNITLASLSQATRTLINLLHDRLSREEYFSNHLLAASPGIISIYNLNLKRPTYIHQNVKHVLGYDVDMLMAVGSNITEEFVHPDDVMALKEHRYQVLHESNENAFQIEYRARHAAGHYVWIRSYEIVFSRDTAGRPAELMVEMFEINREMETALALKRREAQLLEAQDIAMIGSFEWNFRDHTSNHSQQIYRIFEFTGERAFSDFLQYVHPDDRKKVEDAFNSSLLSGQYECEYRYVVNDREKYLWTKGIMDFEEGKPYKMVGTVQDITERRKMEETLLQKSMELEKINADLSEFTYVASHDLKEPLRKISVFADMLYESEARQLSDAGKGYLQKIMESSGRMRQLIDDILTLSSVSAHPEKELISLEAVLTESVGMLDHAIRQKKARVVSDKLPRACMIPVLARQLFLNLISNSLKFSKKDVPCVIKISHAWFDQKKIITSNQANAHFLQLKFTDNGIGFDNEYAEKIFQLFGRLHTKKEFEGTGLGLSICKKIVEEHGGTISASGVPGEGATFVVFLPVEQEGKMKNAKVKMKA